MNTALAWLKRTFPASGWLPEYGRADLRGDTLAGLTVGVMLIPQGMAYAVIAGVPPIYGLYASLVPLLVYPLLGSSRHLAGGVNAAHMIIVAAGVGALAEPGSVRYVQLAILLTVLVGLLELGMGALRLGFLANFLSRPVIAGFTAAAAIIIAVSQTGNILGLELGRSEYIHTVLLEGIREIDGTHLPSLIIAAVGIVLVAATKRWNPRFPGSLLLLVLATAATWWLELAERGVAVVGEVPAGLPAFGSPAVNVADIRSLLPTVITLALVQFLTVVSLGRISAARHGYEIDANRELVAVGAANLTGGFFQSIPVSGSFSRTAVNEGAGARTPLANVVAATVIAVALLYLTVFFEYLPVPALGAIIVVAAAGLVDVDEVRFLFRAKRRDGFVALFTFVSTLVIGIEEGLLLGIGAATVAILYRMSRPHVTEIGHLSATRSFRSTERFPHATRIEGVMLLRIDAFFSFMNARFLKGYILEKVQEGREIHAVIIDGVSINDLDTTALEALHDVVDDLDELDIEIHFAGLTGPIRDVVERSHLGDVLPVEHFHRSPHQAVKHILEEKDAHDGTAHLRAYEHATELPEDEMEPTGELDYI